MNHGRKGLPEGLCSGVPTWVLHPRFLPRNGGCGEDSDIDNYGNRGPVGGTGTQGRRLASALLSAAVLAPALLAGQASPAVGLRI